MIIFLFWSLISKVDLIKKSLYTFFDQSWKKSGILFVKTPIEEHLNQCKHFKNRLSFSKVKIENLELISMWLDQPHVKEFWDNSQAHRDDIKNFAYGRIEKPSYFEGIFTYWIGLFDDIPFSFILTAPVLHESDLPAIWKENISRNGATYSIDFAIGNTVFLNKGLAPKTLDAFVDFFKHHIDSQADTFLIDPSSENPRATHVYKKAGFCMVGDFLMEVGVFKGEKNFLLVKKI